MKNVIRVAWISGIISTIVVMFLFWGLFPTPWLFLIIPGVVGWSIDKYGKFDASKLADDEEFAAMSRKVGITCASIVLLCLIITMLPLFLVMSFGDHLKSIFMYVICGISVYWGYNRGVRCVTDAYFESQK